MQNRNNLEVRKRITRLFFIGLFFLSLLCIRLTWLQLIRGNWYTKKAIENRIREIAVEPKRGTIYDRNGHELAVSINVNAVYAVTAEVKKANLHFTAQKVAQILDLKEDDVYNLLTGKQHSVWLKMKVDDSQARALRQEKLPGIGIIPEPQRFYPKKNLASHLLGIAGLYNQGLEGVEVAYDKQLSGTSGCLLVEYDATGHEIPGSIHKYLEPQQGDNLVLTIDQNIQYIAERELDKVVQNSHPKSAIIIVMDPQTGEIMAMADRPDFDPNNYQQYPASNRRNLAIANSYEPGSIFKIITLSAAIDQNVISEQDHFFCPGYIKVGGHDMHCWNTDGHGSETLTQVVTNSCNPGFITIGLRTGTDKFYKYLQAFGLGHPLGIDLPGEAGGITVPEKNVKPVDLASMSIGQANSLTPLQLVTAMSVVANGGKLVRPYIVKEIKNSAGKVIKEDKPEVIRQVISQQTANEIQQLLAKVVSQGTGSKAYIEGYSVGGKTGTAQIPLPGGGYSATDHVADFLGFAPVENPRLAVLVMVDSPQGVYYGGTVAAPVFREVVLDSLRYLGVPMRYQANQLTLSKDMTVVPPVLNLTLSEAQRILAQAGLKGRPRGQGAIVYSQMPLDGARVKKGSEVILTTDKPKESGSKVVVPELKGRSLRDAAELLGIMGLDLTAQGDTVRTGVAMEQNPVPGTLVTPGTQITVKFKGPQVEPNGP